MALWGKTDHSANTPKFKVIGENSANGANAYGNVTPGAFNSGQAVGVFGVDTTEVGVRGGGLSPGWVVLRQGTGPVSTLAVNAAGGNYGNLGQGLISNGTTNAVFRVTTNATGNVTGVTIVSGGAGFLNTGAIAFTLPANAIYAAEIVDGGTLYSNSDTVLFSNGVVNASANLVTNSTGGITNVVFITGGRGFVNDSATVVTITTATGSGVNLVPNVAAGSGLTLTVGLGGRAGRVQSEVLVVVKGMSGDGTDDALLPDS